MSEQRRRLRQRGIRASRVRLEQALADAGLRTQAALAERIADLEGLDAAPKDLVSRVFRERPVDPQTLERVARALGVEAHTLYLTSTGPRARRAPSPPPARRPVVLGALAGAAALALAVIAWRGPLAPPEPPEPPAAAEAEQAAPATPPADETAAVLAFRGDDGGVFVTALRRALEPAVGLTSPTAAMAVGDEAPGDVARRLQVDLVVSGEITARGRRIAVKVYVNRRDENRLLWADSFLANEREAGLKAAAAEAARALDIALGRSTATPRHHPDEAALEDYLVGWTHLDRSRTELNVKRALTRFESALRRSPNYPPALAERIADLEGLDAAPKDLVSRVFRERPVDPQTEALVAWGDVLRKTGRLEEAAGALGRALGAAPADTDALLAMSELELARYRESGAADAARGAVAYAQRAVESAPGFWKAPYVLGRALYFTDDVAGAVAAVKQARALDPNEHVLSNLGTFQFCAGDFADARRNYLAVKQTAPAFYVGDVHLGVVNYFLGDYEQAEALFQQALDTARQDGNPEDHRQWGNLADARRHAGDAEGAAAAYRRAAMLAERDLAQGDNPENTRAFLAYYYTALMSLDPREATSGAEAAVGAQLAEAAAAATDAEALTRLAEAYVLRGDLDPAGVLYRRVTRRCKGFGASPDLAVLRR
ncbi:MAG: hypothetical protein P8008_00985 [Gammaproteobacteria bacterium]